MGFINKIRNKYNLEEKFENEINAEKDVFINKFKAMVCF